MGYILTYTLNTSLNKNKMYKNNTSYKEIITVLLFLIGYPLIIGYIWMKAWAWVIVPTFSITELSYIQSVVLYCMSSVGYGYIRLQFYPTEEKEKVFMMNRLLRDFNYKLFFRLSASYLFPHIFLLVFAYLLNTFLF